MLFQIKLEPYSGSQGISINMEQYQRRRLRGGEQIFTEIRQTAVSKL